MANFARLGEGKPVGTDNADITVVTDRIDNVESALIGNLSLATIDINGGAIDGTDIGTTTASVATFTNVTVSTMGQVSLTGSAVIDGNLIVTPTAGNVTIFFTTATSGTDIDINFGDINDDTEGLISYDNSDAAEKMTIHAGGGGGIVIARRGVSCTGSLIVNSMCTLKASATVTSHITACGMIIPGPNVASADAIEGGIIYSGTDSTFYGFTGSTYVALN